jgi:acyl carrier protein
VSVVVDEDEKAGEDVIARYRRQLGDRLPEHMVPSAFVVLDALPLTANGKVDRRALPQPDVAAALDYVAPETETELTLAQIWSSLLRIDAAVVGKNSNFFALGGHSLLLVRLVTMIRTQFGLEISMREVMELPDLEALAAVVFERNLRMNIAAAPGREIRDDELEVTL